jgi:hypothetical protein
LESNWRWGVYDYGFANTPVSLAARDLVNPNVVWVRYGDPGASWLLQSYLLASGQAFALLSSSGPWEAHQRFPLGIAVVPDTPM